MKCLVIPSRIPGARVTAVPRVRYSTQSPKSGAEESLQIQKEVILVKPSLSQLLRHWFVAFNLPINLSWSLGSGQGRAFTLKTTPALWLRVENHHLAELNTAYTQHSSESVIGILQYGQWGKVSLVTKCRHPSSKVNAITWESMAAGGHAGSCQLALLGILQRAFALSERCSMINIVLKEDDKIVLTTPRPKVLSWAPSWPQKHGIQRICECVLLVLRFTRVSHNPYKVTRC